MLVSIITVSYNSEPFIEHCIESVNNQEYPFIEHILIDGESTDRTVNIFKSQARRSIKYLSEIDNGIYDAMNKGINLAKGEIIGFLNTDDRFTDYRVINRIVDNFKKYNPDCTYGNLYFKNSKGNISRKWISKEFRSGLFEKSWTPAHPTFYCKKSVYDRHPKYRTDYKIASDVDLMFRFLEIYKIRSKFIDSNLVVMLEGGVSNASLLSTLTIIREVKQTFIENKIKLNSSKYIFHKIIKILRQKVWVY